MGPTIQCSMSWDHLFHRDGRDFKAQNGRCAKVWQLVAGREHVPFKECTHVNKMSESPWSRPQCCAKRQHQLALESCHAGQDAFMGSQVFGCIRWVNHRKRNASSFRLMWKEMVSADVGRKIVNKMLMTLNWAIYDGEVPNMRHSARFWDGEPLHGGGTGARGA